MTDEPSEGNLVSSLCDLKSTETVIGAVSLSTWVENGTLLLATANGDVKRIRVADLPGLQARAFTVMNVGEDKVVSAQYVEEEDEVLLVSAEAMAIRFKVSEVRPTGLPAGGMRGIKLTNGDKVVSAQVARENAALWVITEAGLAKSTPLVEYTTQGRAGSGAVTMKMTLGDRLVAATVGTLNDLVIVLTAQGKFRVTKFRDAPHGRRDMKGDFIGIRMNKSDRVQGVMYIIQRPEVRPLMAVHARRPVPKAIVLAVEAASDQKNPPVGGFLIIAPKSGRWFAAKVDAQSASACIHRSQRP